MNLFLLASLLTVVTLCAATATPANDPPPPVPFGPLPSPRQLTWHEREFYAFVHFNMNTFTGKEWGEGYEDPKQFNPTALDCRQWARVCKAAGMKGIIITAKHHDGFCLWPSKYTEHSVKNSPFRGGKGDVLKELSAACKEYGLKFGVYLSPWDRNHPQYGSPEYNTFFENQLTEVLTGYGEIFEVWFDGANGEGPTGKRQVYDFPAFIALVRKYQPNACIFSDGGPDVRWVGNEAGHANPTNWCLLKRDEIVPGTPRYAELTSGHADGTHWVPAECDVSIRPGWFYRPSEDNRVKTVAQLVDIYYASVGQNASLLLNLPVDTRGLVHETDAERLLGLGKAISAAFAHDLAKGRPTTATSVRGNSRRYAAANATDGNPRTYWAAEDTVTTASLEVDLGSPQPVNRVVLQEAIALGQRVEAFTVEAFTDGQWAQVAEGTTIGHKRILRFPDVTASKVRVNITRSRACPTLSNFSLYHAPEGT
ncbi:MAG TPA: alpha-L-fucosidase [Chthonomonadaceae bacterium]|nr:alpha-L-fucosidase [Chthonomonadaceae bacterium]